MLAFAVRRFVTVLPVLVLVSVISFAVVRLLPGDPATLMLGPGATQQQIQALREQQGLNRPWPVQYVQYAFGILTGNLGTSLASGRPVTDELAQRLPATVELTVVAVILAAPLGVLLGVVSAVKRNSAWDHLTRVIALLGLSVPVFWLALFAQLVFGLWLNLLPVSGRSDAVQYGDTNGFLLVGGLLAGSPERALDALRHLILPALVLGAFFAATLARMTRASLVEVLGEEYVRTARSKGLAHASVIGRHALRNALLPVITLGGLKLAELLSGAVLTESIFAWPGVGRYMYEAIKGRDYPVVQSTLLLFAVLYVVVLLAVDIANEVVDPRLRARAGAA